MAPWRLEEGREGRGSYRSEDSGRVSSEGFLAQVRKCGWKLGIVVPENATIWPSKEVIILLLFFCRFALFFSRDLAQHSNGVLPTLSNIGCTQFAQKKKMVVHHGHALRWRQSLEALGFITLYVEATSLYRDAFCYSQKIPQIRATICRELHVISGALLLSGEFC